MAFKFLSKSFPVEKNFFHLPRRILIFLSSWPNQQIRVLLVVHVIWNLFCLAVGAFGELWFGMRHLSNPVLAFDAICPATTKLVTLFKLTVFSVFRKDLKQIIARLKEFIFKDTSEEKLKLAQPLITLATRLTFLVLCFGFSTNMFYCISPILTIIYQKIIGAEITMNLPFKILFPDSMFRMPRYPFAYLFMGYSGLVTMFGFVSVDGTFVTICLYLSYLFKAVQFDIQRSFLHLKDKNFQSKQESELHCQQLAKIIQRHNDIFELCEQFRNFFSYIMLFHFLSAATVICLSIIDIMLIEGIGVVLYVCYTIAALCQLFLYCFGGTYISEESLKVADAAYATEWYKCQKKVQVMIYLLILRSQRPMLISAPFFSPSLPAFSSILGTAGSYITLLKTFL